MSVAFVAKIARGEYKMCIRDRAYGLEIVENVPIEVTPNEYNRRYLLTKEKRMGHTLHVEE